MPGERVYQPVHFARTRGFSALGVLTVDGMVNTHITNVPGVDAGMFLWILNNIVLPCMEPFPGPNSILILDNASIHHIAGVRELVEAYGCKLKYLPCVMRERVAEEGRGVVRRARRN